MSRELIGWKRSPVSEKDDPTRQRDGPARCCSFVGEGFREAVLSAGNDDGRCSREPLCHGAHHLCSIMPPQDPVTTHENGAGP